MSDLFKISIHKAVYLIYFLMVFFVFFSSLNIIPTNISIVFSIFSISLISLILFYVAYSNFFRLKHLILLIVYIIPIYISQLYNVNNDSNYNRFFLLVFVYPVLFLIFLFMVNKYKILDILKPFFVCVSLIIFLSILKMFDLYDFTFYSANNDLVIQYEDLQSRDYTLAYSGIYLNQNTFAPILMVGFFTYLICFFYSEDKVYKVLSLFGLVLCFLLVLITAARAPIFSLLIGLLFLFLFSKISLINKFFAFTLLIIVGCIFYYYGNDYVDILIAKSNSAGLSHRDIIWNDVYNKLSESFLYGVGLGNYSFSAGYQQYSTHNAYLMFVVSLGILGSLSILFTIFIVITKSLTLLFYDNRLLYKILCSIVVIVFFIHQLFEVIIDNPLKPFTFFLLLAVAYLYANQNEEVKIW